MGSEPSTVENLAPAETSVAAIHPDSVIPPDVVGEILEDHVRDSDPDFRLTLHGDDHTSHRHTPSHCRLFHTSSFTNRDMVM